MSKCRYDLSEDCNNTDCLNCVLDKIRAGIVELQKDYQEYEWLYDDVLGIIDKYKAEQENT